MYCSNKNLVVMCCFYWVIVTYKHNKNLSNVLIKIAENSDIANSLVWFLCLMIYQPSWVM